MWLWSRAGRADAGWGPVTCDPTLALQLATVDVRGRRFIAGGTYRISFSLGKAELSVTLSGEDSYL